MKIYSLIIFILSGILFLATPSALAGNKTMSTVTSAEPDKRINTNKSQDFQTLDSMFSLYQPFLKNISAYKPIYFLVGADPSETRFQFSFRYRFLNPGLSLVKKYHWIQGVHLAYSQTSFWDLKARSQPFKDSSYMPELFFLTPSLLKNFGIEDFFFQTGYQHESNGRGEELSRSTNYLYFKPIFIFFHKRNPFGIQVAPKFWIYANNDNETNPDLKDYRGYFDLGIKAGKADGFIIETHFRDARKGGSFRIDITYPLNNLFKNIDLYFQLQYVNALAENLINYKQRSRAFRLGFSIVR